MKRENSLTTFANTNVQDAGSSSTNLKRNLTLLNVVALLVSITGHVAVFITPGLVVDMSGSVTSTVVFWLVGSFLVYSLALCYTELGTIFQNAGGPYLYITVIFGHFYGFLVVWGYIILISGPFIAFASQTAALYIAKAILDSSCNSYWHKILVTLIACWILLGLSFMNCYCLKVVVLLQNALTACKMFAIGIIIASGVYVLSTRSTENFSAPTEGSHVDPGRISMALTYVIFSNGGWQAVTTLTEEVKNPARTLPRGIHVTFAIISLLFLMTYLSYMVVLDKTVVIHSKAVALTFCEHVWAPLVPVMSILVALACVGALNTGIMGHSRMVFAAARKSDLPCMLSTLHPKYKTPVLAIWTVVLYGFVMMFSGGVQRLMQFIGLYSLILGFKVIVALLYLRYTKPDLHRPYKVPLLFPMLQAVVSIALLLLIIYQEPAWMLFGVLIYLLGIPVYLLGVSWRQKPKIVLLLTGKPMA
ncbi:cystine/glutamate transporter [Biomphalaria glabrata]|nr:cystine/glutamate transporter [Biomphalaria glabrata]